jgi:protein-disulfide isomerase
MSSKNPGQNVQKESRKGAAGIVAIAVELLVVAGVAATLVSCGPGTGSTSAEGSTREEALASEHSPTLGDPGAKVHIVEFLDPACGTCALFYPMVKGWMAEVPGEIRLSIRHVAFHSGADYAVRVLEASRNQDKYWQTLEALLAGQRQWVNNHVVQADNIGPVIAGVGLDMPQLLADMNSAEVTERIERDRKDAVLLKVSATPEYFVNGRPLPSFGQQQLADLVREELGR